MTDNVFVDHESITIPDSTIKDKMIQYDDTKLAPTCFKQFFINYNIETKTALCLLCNNTVKKSGNSTFNFVRHVKRHHISAYNTWSRALAIQKEKIQPEQLSIKHSVNSHRAAKYTSDHPRQMKLSKMVTTDLIIGLTLPLSIVEQTEFLRMMQTIDSKFVVPSQHSLCHDVLPKAVEKIESELKRVCKLSRFVSLTLDIWIDRRIRCFYAITIHLIDQYLCKSHLLAFKYLSGSHGGNKLRQEYEAITAQYGIEEKLVRVVINNPINNIKAIGSLILPGFESYFEESLDELADEEDDRETNLNEIDHWCDTLLVTDELLRLPCYIRTLQSVVFDGFKESICIKPIITKISSIAKFSYKSTVMTKKLEQDGFNIPIPMITAWASQYYTVAKIIEIPSDKLNDCLQELKQDSLILSQHDIAVLNEFVSLLALFAEVFTRAQAEQTALISMVAPSLVEIYFDLESEQDTLKYTSDLCKALLISMQARFRGLFKRLGLSVDVTGKIQSTSELYADSLFLIAPFLDARFGIRWVIHSKLQDQTKDRLCETIKRLVTNAALQLHELDGRQKAEITGETPLAISNNTTNITSKRKILFDFLKAEKPLVKKTRSSVLQQVQEEVLLFSKEASDDNALIFKKAKKYPYLSLLALQLLCVPATSAPIERVFSTSGFTIRPYGGSLTKEMLAKLTFLKCNSDLLH